jgi:monoamine oxidase
MSRSSIMRRVRSVLAQQQPALVAALPPMHRRALLSGLARAGGAALAGGVLAGLGAPAWAAGPAGGRTAGRRPQRVGVVGGGIAGLVAALTLRDAGQPCTVFEPSTRLGGRMHSNHGFWAQGQTSEWCGEFIDTDHVLLRALARRFHLPLDDVNRADPPHSVDTNYFLGGYYTDAELAADMHPVSRVMARQAAAVGDHYFWNDHNRVADYFDRMNCYEWIETYVPGGHASRLGRYLDQGMVGLNGLDTPLQSALNLIIPFHSDERFHVRNGNQQIPLAIAAHLPAGTVQMGWGLTAVAASNAGVSLAFATPEGPQSRDFDRVILALPFKVLRSLDFSQAGFEPRKVEMIRQFAYGTNSKLILQFDDRYWNGRGAWPGHGDGFVSTDLPFQSTWDTSRAQPGAAGLLTNYTGGTQGAAYKPDGPFTDSLASPATAAYAVGLLAQMEQVWPGITPHYTGLANLSYPTGDPFIQASYSAFGVGQFTTFAGYGGVAQGRIHFAGEHTEVRFVGYMEGGAESGARAAAEVLAAAA